MIGPGLPVHIANRSDSTRPTPDSRFYRLEVQFVYYNEAPLRALFLRSHGVRQITSNQIRAPWRIRAYL